MLGAWILPLLTIFNSGDSLLLKSIPVIELNNFRSQYFPIYSPARKDLFFTVRKAYKSDEEIFVAKWNGNTFESPWPIEELNQENNEGTPTLSKDGKTMIFSGCDYPNSFGGCDLYGCNWAEGVWSKPKNLGFTVNSHDWEGQPQLSNDGKKLFFSSDRQGGEGKRDLWCSEINVDGQWGMPKNLGKNINTSEDEQGPYFIQSRDILVFSSNKKGGIGELDFYQSLFFDLQWTLAVNIKEVNSTYNDAGFSEGITPNSYFISRKIKDSEQDLQIHQIEIPDFCWIPKPIIPIISENQTKPNLNKEIKFEEIKFSDIQFENNQFKLPNDTPSCLNDLTAYLQINTSKSIEIHGHTDEVGTKIANQILSEKRALTIKNYLISQGIFSERIIVKGFGNSRPKFSNTNLVDRKSNRRIEIILP